MADAKKERRDKELSDLAWLMADARGRAVMKRMLRRLKYGTVFRAVGGLPETMWPIYNGAWMDFGNWLEEEIGEADPSHRLVDAMNQEYRNRKALEAARSADVKSEEEDEHAD